MYINDFNGPDDDDDELFYSNKGNTYNSGTTNWWYKVECNISLKGAEIKDDEYVDESDGLASLQGSDDAGNKKKQHKRFNEKHDLNILVELEVGELFTNTYSFKKALKTYDVQNEFDYLYKHNDKGRVSTICKERHCSQRIHAFIDAKRTSIQIKIFYPIHICGNHYENSRCNVEYLVHAYKSSFKDDPIWTPYALQQRVKRDHNIDVPIVRCYRVKNEASLQLLGSHAK